MLWKSWGIELRFVEGMQALLVKNTLLSLHRLTKLYPFQNPPRRLSGFDQDESKALTYPQKIVAEWGSPRLDPLRP